jgi:hypothetical protein
VVTAAVTAPMPQRVSVIDNPYPDTAASPSAKPDADADMTAQGRRAVSTAFVRLGPGGHLLLTLRNGSDAVLSGVTMEQRAVCGVAVVSSLDGQPGNRQCHKYAEIANARAMDSATIPGPMLPGSDATSSSAPRR